LGYGLRNNQRLCFFIRNNAITPEKKALNIEQERRQHQQWLGTFLRNSGNTAAQDALGYLKPQTHLIKGGARKEIPMLANPCKSTALSWVPWQEPASGA
jgi:hypothetical protein